MTDHFKQLDEWLLKQPPPDKNPLVRKLGHGPKDKKCSDCRFLFKRDRYYKCKCRPHGNSQNSDHRLSWNSCRLFEAAK